MSRTERRTLVALVALLAMLMPLAIGLGGVRIVWAAQHAASDSGQTSSEDISQTESHAAAAEEHAASGHSDPFSFILIELALIVVLAAFGRWGATRLKHLTLKWSLARGRARV
jgi:hypothetical protein